MNQLTPEQMAKKAVLMRARNEASIVRAFFINTVLPTVEAEFDRRLSSGEAIALEMPDAVDFAKAYTAQFFADNAVQQQTLGVGE